MSEVKRAPIWYPPQFPIQGRLPQRAGQVHQNIQRRGQLEGDYHDALSAAAGRRVMPPCCRTLHISLCFDGTGNNLNHDLYLSTPRHPTNIARLFRASIGDGYAGGTAHSKAYGLVDEAGTGNGQYYKYYMPGVGTPFPEVGDLNYDWPGLALASYGEERVNWGLLMLVDALRRMLGLPRQDNANLLASVKAMGSTHGLESLTGRSNRRREFVKQFWPLLKPLDLALRQQTPGQSKLLGIKLYVYGFSRGAAAARAFVCWLDQLLSNSEATPALKFAGMEMPLPISVEYLGLLDTVASVGAADIFPVAQGHMSWADGTQELPTSSLVKRCLHIVASHEQRQCFPLDSIRRQSGEYPDNSQEVLHPGMHSDQGGGYPPGDQGKAISQDPRVGDGLLLSQIALQDLYADAFAHGAPLKVPKEALPMELHRDLWRMMEFEVVEEFRISSALVNRFNAWRLVTLGLTPSTQPLPIERVEDYQPLQAPVTVEEAIRDQMGWITAWRIDRYAFATLRKASFYLNASDTEADPEARSDAEARRNQKQAEVKKRRREQTAREHFERTPSMPPEPGVKDFDPDMAQTQLREAAEEFAQHFRGEGLTFSVAIWRTRSGVWVSAQLLARVWAERKQMKALGLSRVRSLFPPPKHEQNHLDENTRGNVDESRNAGQPEGLLRALFDDQVHDSRAWFLYIMCGREPFGSYLLERMIFFGDVGSRELVRYDENGEQLLASSTESVPVYMDPERKAQALRNIEAQWKAFHASAAGEVDDASV